MKSSEMASMAFGAVLRWPFAATLNFDSSDTAWMLASSALVGGMMRKTNVLAT